MVLVAALIAFKGNSSTFPFSSEASAEGVVREDSQTMELLGTNAFALLSNPAQDVVAIDQDALLPEVGSAGSLRDIYEIPRTDLVEVYTVQSGDTLEGIAKMFDVSPNTIKWANNLSSNKLKEGMSLTILPVTGVRVKVNKGDTLQSIAKKYNGDAADIAAFNGLGTSDALIAGSTIIIPDGEIGVTSQSIQPSRAKRSGASAPSGYYIRPVAGVKTQGFHGRHEAVDVGAPPGTPIYAMADGVVKVAKKSGYNGGYGQLVVIGHPNGTETWYGHMSRVFVNVGQQVKQGEHIANVGSTGRSTGPHLHYEVRGIKTPILY